MTHASQVPTIQSTPWFKRWFNSIHYHKLYQDRDEQEAIEFVDNLLGYLEPAPAVSILDVGCGAGRHCRQFASKGFIVTGIDLSSASIREARKYESESLHFFIQDMRNPFGYSEYDYVFNFFTSFGYFKAQAEHNRVIFNMSKALKNGGTLVLDYMNVHYIEDRLVPYEEKEVDGINYYISRWMDEKYFYKKIVVDEGQSGEPFENVEQVARFTLDDFSQMFSCNNFQIEDVFGNYQLDNFEKKSSPRLITIAKKV